MFDHLTPPMRPFPLPAQRFHFFQKIQHQRAAGQIDAQILLQAARNLQAFQRFGIEAPAMDRGVFGFQQGFGARALTSTLRYNKIRA